ncbi:Arsb [Symbiodinium sp. CCMP2456]|nr:Arsb [Symbiodinium sp. CCMP2456]
MQVSDEQRTLGIAVAVIMLCVSCTCLAICGACLCVCVRGVPAKYVPQIEAVLKDLDSQGYLPRFSEDSAEGGRQDRQVARSPEIDDLPKLEDLEWEIPQALLGLVKTGEFRDFAFSSELYSCHERQHVLGLQSIPGISSSCYPWRVPDLQLAWAAAVGLAGASFELQNSTSQKPKSRWALSFVGAWPHAPMAVPNRQAWSEWGGEELLVRGTHVLLWSLRSTCAARRNGKRAVQETRPAPGHWQVLDDWGYHDIGFRNPEMRTPTLDSFHHEGVTLDQYYVLPTCSPSRATFLTGRLPIHHGLNSKLKFESVGLPLDEKLLPALLKEQGYKTHAVGKWHLGFYRAAYTPTFRGFDSFYGYYMGSQGYFTHKLYTYYDFHRQDKPNCGKQCSRVEWKAAGIYSTRLFTEEAVRLIRRHSAYYPGQPLFLYQAWQNVHYPVEVPRRFLPQFSNLISNTTRQVHAAMVAAVDEGIASINAALSSVGMLENSVIIVTGDNGGAIDECLPNGASNYPLRGGKCSVWEGGARSTALVYAPGRVPQGLVFPGLFHASDWLPTIMEGLLGAEVKGTKPVDGLNLWPALAQNASSPRSDIFYGIADHTVGFHGPALRTADGWKLLLNGGGGSGRWSNESRLLAADTRTPQKIYPQLFDLKTDPSERFDLSQERPDIMGRLRSLLFHYERSGRPQVLPDRSCRPNEPTRSLDWTMVLKCAQRGDHSVNNVAVSLYLAGLLVVERHRERRRPLKAAGRFVHKSAPIAPLLQVLGPIIRGFQQPLGEVQKKLLFDTLIPLHKPNEWLLWDRQTPMISMYHKELVHCMLLMLEKDPTLAGKCVEAVCSHFPPSHESNTPKEVLLIHEIAEILKVLDPEDAAVCMPQLQRHILRLLTSQNGQTLQSVLQLWKDERVSKLLANFADSLIPGMLPLLVRDGEVFWNPTVNKMTCLVLEKLEAAKRISACSAMAAQNVETDLCSDLGLVSCQIGFGGVKPTAGQTYSWAGTVPDRLAFLSITPCEGSGKERENEEGVRLLLCRRVRRDLQAVFELPVGEPVHLPHVLRQGRIGALLQDLVTAQALDRLQDAQCVVGRITLRLLLCLWSDPAARRCDPEALQGDVLVALGLEGRPGGQPVGLEATLRSGWPTLRLIHLYVSRLRALKADGDLRRADSWSAEMGGRLLQGALMPRSSSLADQWQEEVVLLRAAVEIMSRSSHYEACKGFAEWPSCPYRPPFDLALCGQGALGSLTIQLASDTSRCLGVGGILSEDVPSGSPIHVSDCLPDRGAKAQRFLVPEDKGEIRLAEHPTKCLDIRGRGEVVRGTPIQLDACASTPTGVHPNQRFVIPGRSGQVRWAKNPSWCLAVSEGTLVLDLCDQPGSSHFLLPAPAFSQLCREGLDMGTAGPGAPLLAAAAALAALAMRGLTVPDGGCAGAERLCGAALRSAGREGLEVMWQEAESALLAGLTLEEAPALETLARMPWPLTELLAAASRKGHDAAQQTSHPTPGRGGICACDLSLWPVEEARSVAAAQKVLEEINGGPKTLDALSQALESPSAKTACGAAWGGRLATAEKLLSELWGLHPDLPMEESLPLAASLRDSGWAFDAGVCLAGVASLGIVCSTRQLLSGDFSKGTEAAHATYVCLSALLGCVDLGQILPTPSYGSLPDWQALRMDFVEDWPELAIWIPDPLRFFFQVQGPVLRSSRWLHGSDASARVASLLSSRQRGKTASAATACSGVWNLTTEHPCWSMQGARKDSKPGEVAQTRILGTGLMKAGTTVIWQCLAAAGNFSMGRAGLDCDGLAEACHCLPSW